MAFLDSTVVNVALPTVARDLHSGLTDLQWISDAYLLTLGALIVLGGSLGDRFGRRRVFVFGLTSFTAASVICGLAPNTLVLIVARALQGVGGALLVPGSLAIISACFVAEDRSRAVGLWSGMSGVTTAAAPFIGGWLVDSVSWRAIFFINVPLAAGAVAVALRHVPETRDESATGSIDAVGAITISVGLAGLVYALIGGPGNGWSAPTVLAGIVGAVLLLAFPLIELRRRNPMIPMGIFVSRQFSGANLTTFAVYAALSATAFLLVLHLQQDLRYSALQAGLAFLPASVLLILLSSRAGALAQRIGAQLPMTVGPIVAAAGLLLLGGIRPHDSYLTAILPGVLVFGAGLTLTVAPLTAAVMAAVGARHLGVGSAINNATARIGGLLAVAVVPALAGLTAASSHLAGVSLTDGFTAAMRISAGLLVAGGLMAALTIRRVPPAPERTGAAA
ncbi:MAG: DHA2 family efflux MFS transporter permease subunit [Candidatus Dormibacteraeota bacterium]|uniref:DHA2 family efflux MFS transporter permease subunit n=1 Tax=Candidatus Amunia macphersoniae TaxID=3127014 RepID=A0A934NIH6_9BACT|nr:DHA2 family efflux MFS transporter permease subunit [Candidatus Dormibacteraeota bacterium]